MPHKSATIRFVRPVHLLAIIALWLLVAFTPMDREIDNEMLQQILDEEMKDYRSWNLIPGSKKLVAGSGPHGDFISVYVNNSALQAISNNAQTMPEGAIIVKDNYTENKKYRSTVVMKKVSGRWFWGLLKPYGKVRSAGFGAEGERMDTCQNCHNAAKKDMVFYWKDPR